MKRFLLIALALCLLLCGCTDQPPAEETTLPTETQAPVDPTEPAGCYDPNSAVEARYQGAVRAYPLSVECSYAAAQMGSDVLIFSGAELTTLTLLSGENLYITAQVELSVGITPTEASTQVTEKGVAYYSPETGEVVLLDTALKEVARIKAPEDIVGVPVLSEDRQSLYYCTVDSIRVLDMEKGISRLLKEISWPQQSADSLLLGDTVLRCELVDEEGQARSIFISTETGELVGEYWETLTVASYEDTYYAKFMDGAMQALVYGQADGQEQMLIPEDVTAESWYVPELNAAVTASMAENGTMVLEFYDLGSGLRGSVLELPGTGYPLSVTAGTENRVYVLCYDYEQETEVLYRWDTAALATNETTCYTSARYTLENPDSEGLAACREYAAQLNERYGVEILIGTDATAHQPWDYSMIPEYQVPMIRRDLELLDRLLAVYPEGFLVETVDSTASGVLRICLVRTLAGTPESGSLETAEGIHFWVDEDPYIALCVGQMTDRLVFHEIFHAIETKVYSDSQIYYEWDKLNPEGFDYDYSYLHYQEHEDSEYLQDETRAFIDSYSMTFPKEDRARIMEYAMTEGNESYFQSETMQTKLYQLCLGIRKAYGLTKSEEVYPWEQYLVESLAYVPEE